MAAELRDAGLVEVETVAFERHGVRGTNVIATLRAPGDEFVVVGAHHDTAPEAPGAYDDGGGVGVLIELARVLVADGRRARTVVFASFDGEEASATARGRPRGRGRTSSGSAPGPGRWWPPSRSRCAGGRGARRSSTRSPTRTRARRAGRSSRRRGSSAPPSTGPARRGPRSASATRSCPGSTSPRCARSGSGLYGDDLSFLQAGHPALFASDSSFSAFYPDYHAPSDTADKLDAAALARMGRSALGVVRALERVPRGEAEEPHWFAAFGRVVGGPWLLALGAASLLPGLWRGWRRGGPALGLRVVQAVLAGVLLWRHPVPALWLLLVPQLAPALAPLVVDRAAVARSRPRPPGDRRLGLVARGRERRLARAVGDRGRGARPRSRVPRTGRRRKPVPGRSQAPRAQAPLGASPIA